MGDGALGYYAGAVSQSSLGESWIPVERSGSGLSARLIGEFHELLGLGLQVFRLIVRLGAGRKSGDDERERQSKSRMQNAHT